MEEFYRDFAYGTGCLVIGLAVVVFTHVFIKLADQVGSTGYFVLFAFGIAFFSLSFAINKRYILKSVRHMLVNYLFSFLIIAPTLVWAYFKTPELDDSRLTFFLVVVFVAFLGTYAGTRYGIDKRDAYLAQLKEQEEQMPDDLKRPHDDLSNN